MGSFNKVYYSFWSAIFEQVILYFLFLFVIAILDRVGCGELVSKIKNNELF